MKESARKTRTVVVECERCGGTGIYPGTLLASGIGKVCSSCHGRGWRMLHFIPFTERGVRTDVHTVMSAVIDKKGVLHSHSWGDHIPYARFLELKVVQPPSDS
jgi:hypothetical protein